MNQAKILCVLLASLYLSHAAAQEGNEIVLEDMKTPASPVFVLLGSEPTSITRPTTPRGLATSLLSNVGNGSFIPDVSLDFAPFWLKSHPHLSFEEYYNLDIEKGGKPSKFGDRRFARDFKQTSNFSIAAGNLDKSSNGSSLGIGYRVQLYKGQISHHMKSDWEFIDSIRQELDNLSNEGLVLSDLQQNIEGLIDADLDTLRNNESLLNFIAQRIDILANYPPFLSSLSGFKDDDGKKAFLTNYKYLLLGNDKVRGARINSPDEALALIMHLLQLENNKPKRIEAIQRFRDIDFNMRGWSVEFASASLLDFPTNDWSYSRISKFGAWFTVSYRPNKGKAEHLEILAVARYLGVFGDTVSNMLDAGARFVFAKDKFNISAEVLGRLMIAQPSDDICTRNGEIIDCGNRSEGTYRIAVNAEYKLSEIIYITATFGKDFGQPYQTDVKSSLLAILGINFGLPSKQNLETSPSNKP
ncbi:hypothetical protein BH09BAC1_BH09BAC1_07960 [soil metagenome]